jgi:hypothetical protein
VKFVIQKQTIIKGERNAVDLKIKRKDIIVASLFFNIAKKGFLDGTIDFDTHVIKAALVMTNTTADTEAGVDTVGTITTLDESDATGYARLTLGTKTVTADDTNNRGVADAADLSFTGLSGNATRAYQGVLIYREVTNDTDNIPIAFSEFPTTVPATATQVDVTVNAAGLIHLA